jgi:hypothetical protein
MRKSSKQLEIQIDKDLDIDRHHSKLVEHAQSIPKTGRDFIADDLENCLKKSHDDAFHLGLLEALADLRVALHLKDGKMEVIASVMTADMNTHISRSLPIEYFRIDTVGDFAWVNEKVSYEEDDDEISIKFWKD